MENIRKTKDWADLDDLDFLVEDKPQLQLLRKFIAELLFGPARERELFIIRYKQHSAIHHIKKIIKSILPCKELNPSKILINTLNYPVLFCHLIKNRMSETVTSILSCEKLHVGTEIVTPKTNIIAYLQSSKSIPYYIDYDVLKHATIIDVEGNYKFPDIYIRIKDRIIKRLVVINNVHKDLAVIIEEYYFGL